MLECYRSHIRRMGGSKNVFGGRNFWHDYIRQSSFRLFYKGMYSASYLVVPKQHEIQIRSFEILDILQYISYFLQLEDYDEDDFIPDTEPLQQFSSHIGGIYKVILHPLDEETFASCSTDCSIKIWKLIESKRGQNRPYHSLEGHFGYVVDITWLSTGWRLASASHDGSVKIWDTKKGLCYDTKSLKFALILAI